MIRKLDKLVIKAFIGPFAAVFFITLFVLVMQFFWLYIDDFVGKGLGIVVIMKFIWYQSAVLVPLALPLAVLLSSLMAFGNLGESFELVAIKSSGISLLRFMRPLFFISILISAVAFMFSNYIIPVAALKSRTLLTDIVNAQPAFDIKEGVFYDKLNEFAIKIGKKEPNDSVIRDIIIYEQSGPLQDNFIIARDGILHVLPGKRLLEFDLKNGWRYQERGESSTGQGTEYIRIGFKEYKKQFDLSAFQINWTPDSVNKHNERMYSMRQLTTAIDSLEKENRSYAELSVGNFLRPLHFAGLIDTAWKGIVVNDSFTQKKRSFESLLPDSAINPVNRRVEITAGSVRDNLQSYQTTMDEKKKNLRRHKIEWHRKITLSLACLVLFLIGAPLGSIIRKGGLGTPLIFSIIFFMVFYFSSTTGEKFAKENSLTPFAGMWMATFILLPIGVFLTYKAMRDSQLFNKEFYFRVTRFFRRLISRA